MALIALGNDNRSEKVELYVYQGEVWQRGPALDDQNLYVIRSPSTRTIVQGGDLRIRITSASATRVTTLEQPVLVESGTRFVRLNAGEFVDVLTDRALIIREIDENLLVKEELALATKGTENGATSGRLRARASLGM